MAVDFDQARAEAAAAATATVATTIASATASASSLSTGTGTGSMITAAAAGLQPLGVGEDSPQSPALYCGEGSPSTPAPPAPKRPNLAERPPSSLGARNADGAQVGGGSFDELPVDEHTKPAASDGESENSDATAMSETDEQDDPAGMPTPDQAQAEAAAAATVAPVATTAASATASTFAAFRSLGTDTGTDSMSLDDSSDQSDLETSFRSLGHSASAAAPQPDFNPPPSSLLLLPFSDSKLRLAARDALGSDSITALHQLNKTMLRNFQPLLVFVPPESLPALFMMPWYSPLLLITTPYSSVLALTRCILSYVRRLRTLTLLYRFLELKRNPATLFIQAHCRPCAVHVPCVPCVYPCAALDE